MADLKREYVVPLRRKSKFAPKWRRSKKAVTVLKDFIRQHMKTEEVIVCKELNEHIWSRGSKQPPGKVSVVALKTKIGTEEATIVNLLEAGVDTQVKLYQAPVPKGAKVAPATAPVKEAEVKEAKTPEKKEEKVEAKEVKAEEVKNG